MMHDILEETSLKETNYEPKIRRKENLNTVSREVVPNKCDNLSKNTSPNLFEEALVIKEMKYKQNEKMKTLQKDKMRNIKYEKEKAKLKDLELLKNCLFHDPFNSKRDVTKYMASKEANKNKRNHLCREMWCAEKHY